VVKQIHSLLPPMLLMQFCLAHYFVVVATAAVAVSNFVYGFMSDLLHIADAICGICDLLSNTELLPITGSMQFRVKFALQFDACDLLHARFLRNCITDTESNTQLRL
jgi:hypothetical protein